MRNDDVLRRFERWLLAGNRADGTIRLRMRHMSVLARRLELLEVSEEDLEDALVGIRRLAPETRKSTLASWRVFYRWAYRKGHIPGDPTADMQSIDVPPGIPRVAPDAAVEAALRTADNVERAMILLGRGAWLRLSEIARLHTDDREGDMLRVLGKGSKVRLVPANADVCAALDTLERTQGPGYYFRGREAGHMHPVSVHKKIVRATGYNPHSLRHAGATAGLRATRNLRAVQEVLGHASVATTQRYTHQTDEERRAVTDASRLAAAA